MLLFLLVEWLKVVLTLGLLCAGVGHIAYHSSLLGSAVDSRIWTGSLVLRNQHGPWQAEFKPGAACTSAQLLRTSMVPS